MTNRFTIKPNKTLEEIGVINCQFGAQDDYPRRYDGIKKSQDDLEQFRIDLHMAEMQRMKDRHQESLKYFSDDCTSRDVKPNKQLEENTKKKSLDTWKEALLDTFKR